MDSTANDLNQPTFRVDEATGAKFRACNSCKRFNVPLFDSRRTCPGCRQKRNDNARKYREKSRAKQGEAAQAAIDAEQSSSPTLWTSSFTHHSQKRKAEPGDLEGEDGKPRGKIVKHSSKAAEHKEQLPTNKIVSPRMEYQSASLLYEAAKKSYLASRPYNFSGCHSIVRCDDVNHRRRAKIVTKDLRKIAKLSFKYDEPQCQIDSKVRCVLRYKCDCNESSTTGGPSKSSTKKNQNDDITNLSCGGFVTIKVRDDDSHPLGIPGQQIVVEIHH